MCNSKPGREVFAKCRKMKTKKYVKNEGKQCELDFQQKIK